MAPVDKPHTQFGGLNFENINEKRRPLSSNEVFTKTNRDKQVRFQNTGTVVVTSFFFISIKSLYSEISLAITFSFESTISLTCNALGKNNKQVSYESKQWTMKNYNSFFQCSNFNFSILILDEF